MNQHKKMLWKNGAGITYQIDRQPDDDQEEFHWRLSMAQIKSPGGPFSIFPNIDRTLSIIQGNLLTLLINNEQFVHLDQNSEPFSFPGENSIDAQINEETLIDFNVMTRRNQFKHTVQRFTLDKNQNPMNISNTDENILFIVVSNGILQVNESLLEKGDVFKSINNGTSMLILSSKDQTTFYLVYIIKLSS